jgi:hypothetical protein
MKPVTRTKTTKTRPARAAKAYDHQQQQAVLRPDIGLQAQFKKKLPPTTCRYDRSLDPQLSWDINADREHAEALIAQIRQHATALERAVPPTPPAGPPTPPPGAGPGVRGQPPNTLPPSSPLPRNSSACPRRF